MTLPELFTKVVGALEPLQAEIPDLNIDELWHDTIEPPCLWVFPSTPFQDRATHGPGNNRVYLTVRAFARLADPESGQRLLIRMLDPSDAASVELALAAVGVDVVPDGIDGFGQHTDQTGEQMVTCEWRISDYL